MPPPYSSASSPPGPVSYVQLLLSDFSGAYLRRRVRTSSGSPFLAHSPPFSPCRFLTCALRGIRGTSCSPSRTGGRGIPWHVPRMPRGLVSRFVSPPSPAPLSPPRVVCSLPPGIPPGSWAAHTPKTLRSSRLSELSALVRLRSELTLATLTGVRLGRRLRALLAPSRDLSRPVRSTEASSSPPRSGALHILHGVLNSVPCRFLVDSGATNSFTSRAFAEAAAMAPSSAFAGTSPHARAPLVSQRVSLGDGRLVVLGHTFAPGAVSVPSVGFSDVLPHLFVLPTLSASFDVVLGMDWLQRHNPVIHWGSRTYAFPLHKPSVTFCLDDVLPVAVATPRPLPTPPFVLSHASFLEPTPFLMTASEVNSSLSSGDGTVFFAAFVSPSSAPLSPSPATPLAPDVSRLCTEFSDVMPPDLPPGLPPPRFQHRIELVDPTRQPKNTGIRPLSPAELEECRSQVDELLRRGFIVPSASNFAAPVLFARKPGGGLRMCIDYRQLNSNTRKNAFPLPRVEDMLDRLLGATVFSKLDLSMAFHQIPLHPDSVPLTAFRTRFGLFEFKVLPFGLVNAPATFQATMHRLVLDGLIDRCVFVYIDDILVFSRSRVDHLRDLRFVLERLRRHRLFLKPSKCEWALDSVSFLGHVVTSSGVRCVPDKLDTIRSWPRPTSVAELWSFLGFCNYYRRFIPRFSLLAAPLYALSRLSSTAEWSPSAAASFLALRHAMSSPPVLAVPNPALAFHLSADAASSAGVGAVLWQYSDPSDPTARRPVSFFSRRFSDVESRLGVHLQEGLAVVSAFRHWRHHLEGALSVIVHTDHHSLTRLQRQPSLDRTQAGWLDTLAMIDFIVYNRGSSPHHVPADALSRRPLSAAGRQLSSLLFHLALSPFTRASAARQAAAPAAVGLPIPPPPVEFDPVVPDARTAADVAAGVPPPAHQFVDNDFTSSYASDAWALDLVRALSPSTLVPAPQISRYFSLAGTGILSFEGNRLSASLATSSTPPVGRIVVGSSAGVRTRILDAFHALPSSGHFGAARTYASVASLFYWPTLARDVAAFCASCDSCQRHKHSTTQGPGVALPMPIPSQPLEALAMDWVTGLPLVDGFDAVLVVSCRLTRLVEFIPANAADTAADTATRFRMHWFRRFGLPSSIVSDRDPKVLSHFWAALMSQLGVSLRLSSSSHPQTDGQSERNIQTLELMLRHWVGATQSHWLRFLPEAEFAFNSSKHATTGYTPFELLLGFTPRSPAVALATPPPGDAIRPPPSVRLVPAAVLVLTDHLRAMLRHAADSVAAAQRSASAAFDARHTPATYVVGDTVLLARVVARHLPLRTLPGTASKLEPRWLGPFPILEVRGPRTYKLLLPATMKGVNPVIDVEKLAPYTPSDPTLFPGRAQAIPPPPDVVDGQDEWEVESIIATRLFRGRTRQFLVKWKGYPASDCSWEPLANLQHARDLVRQFDPSLVLLQVNVGSFLRTRPSLVLSVRHY